MTRRRARGPQPAALFSWTPGGQVQTGEARANPLTVACEHPPCHAAKGQPCTTRTPHPSRVAAADTAARTAREPTETPPSAAQEPRTEPTG